MEIFCIDDMSPEDVATLAALYSRSPCSVQTHLAKLEKDGFSEKLVSQYYVQYNHRSIMDCGSTSLFIENVSFLAAKAIQDSPLYRGQEASTRYLDFSKQGCVTPGAPGSIQNNLAATIQGSWIELYNRVLERLVPHFEARFPKQPDEKQGVWSKAIRAKAFDVARALLPSGGRTYVAWHTDLRQAHDHIKLLRNNPMPEIREVGEALLRVLKDKYPSSFGHNQYPDQESYLAESVTECTYTHYPLAQFSAQPFLDYPGLLGHKELLANRPPKTELHQRLRKYGIIQFEFPLDFGSYRDIQRQRSAVIDMPLLTIEHGIHPWYLDQMPDDLRQDVLETVGALEYDIRNLDCSALEKQYVIPLGYQCQIRMATPLPAAVYIAELRSGDTVHPTLRIVAQQMGEWLKANIPGLAMHHDMSPGTWNIKRGSQDIVQKSACPT